MPNLISPQSLNPGYLINNDYRALQFDPVADWSLISLEKNMRITFAVDANYFYFRLENNVNPELSLVRLKKISINNEEYYSVDKSRSFIQGRYYAGYLYEYCFCYLDFPIISDEVQTRPGSSNLWKKFQLRQHNHHYEILTIDTQINTKKIFTPLTQNDYDVWGLEQSLIDIINQDVQILHDAYNKGDISKNLYDFLIQGLQFIGDKSIVRLIGQSK